MEKSVIALSVLFALVFLFVAGYSHAASSGYLYSAQSNVTLNQTSALQHESVQLFSNSSLSVIASANSSKVFFSTASFNLTPTTGYNFSFYVNASSPATYQLLFSSKAGNKTVSLPIPVIVQKVQVKNTTSPNYNINIFGNVQSNSQVVIYVTQNGNTVTSGNIFVQYNNISDHYSLSTVSSYATIDFPLLYGDVIFEYVAPNGQLVGPEVIQVANATRLPTSQVQTLTAYCNGKESNIEGSNGTIISTYTITPYTNITCSLYNQNTAAFVSGVTLQVISAVGVPSMPYASNSFGQVVIPYPQGGWPIGMMALKPASKLYTIGAAYFNVVQMPNPLTYSVSGNTLTINPVIPQDITLGYPNGTKVTRNYNSSFNVTTVGDVSITGINSSYTTFSKVVDLKQTQLQFVVLNGHSIQTSGNIYPYLSYKFELLNNNSQVSSYTGTLVVGGTNLNFDNGVATGYLASYNLTFQPYSNQYYIYTGLVAVPLSFYLSLPANPATGTLYPFTLVPMNISYNLTDPLVHYSGNIYLKEGTQVIPIPISDGSGTISFSSSPAVLSFNGTSALVLAEQAIYPVDTSGRGFIYAGVGIALVVIILLAVLLSRGSGRKVEFIGEE